MHIAEIKLSVVAVTAKTKWTFVEVRDGDGRCGTGEASLLGREPALADAFTRLAQPLLGQAADPTTTERVPIPARIEDSAIWSAIDQALWDLRGQRLDTPLAVLLCRSPAAGVQAPRPAVDVYANINRRTVDRMPAGFAASARDALAAGFTAVKLAPFDEVSPANASIDLAASGLARIRAVRQALPAKGSVLVDCHWRFSAEVATRLVPLLAAAGACWYECPISEGDDAGPTLACLRRASNAAGLRLTGRETGVGRRPFLDYAAAKAYDVMMPDVKYIGGMTEMLETARALDDLGCRMSPHNHTGPIAHAASLAVALSAAGCDLLEMQFDETPYFDLLVGGAMPAPKSGRLAAVARPGLGLALVPDITERLAVDRRVVA